MIATCPRCEARYRVDEQKVGPKGARLRCARCQSVFRIRAPAGSERRPEAEPALAPARARPSTASPGMPNRREESVSGPAAPPNRDRLVLVADPTPEVGKQTVTQLSAWGLETILVHDGVEAMLAIQRSLPRVVILDAALPKMYGFQICEVMKRNASLQGIPVVLVGAIHHNNRYHRPPSELYGADVYLEHPNLMEGLASALERFGVPLEPGSGEGVSPEVPRTEEWPTPPPARPEADPVVPSAPSPGVAAPVAAPEPTAADDGLESERAKAERLARIVISDIVLYQGEKFDAAIRAGNLLEAMDSDLEEGRHFFRERIDERVRSERDYLVEELQRVARERAPA